MLRVENNPFLLQIVTLFTAVNLFLLSADLRIVLNYRRDLQTCQSGDCFQVSSTYVLFHVGEHISGVHGTLSTLMSRMSFGKRCRTQQRKRVSLRKHVFAQSCYCLQLLWSIKLKSLDSSNQQTLYILWLFFACKRDVPWVSSDLGKSEKWDFCSSFNGLRWWLQELVLRKNPKYLLSFFHESEESYTTFNFLPKLLACWCCCCILKPFKTLNVSLFHTILYLYVN